MLGNRNSFQRKLIRLAYEEIYHEDLIHQLKSEISGDFEVNFLMFTSFTCMDFYLSLHVLQYSWSLKSLVDNKIESNEPLDLGASWQRCCPCQRGLAEIKTWLQSNCWNCMCRITGRSLGGEACLPVSLQAFSRRRCGPSHQGWHSKSIHIDFYKAFFFLFY